MYSAYFFLAPVTQREGVLVWLTIGHWRDRWKVAKCKSTLSQQPSLFAIACVCLPMTLKVQSLENWCCVSFPQWTLRACLGFWRCSSRNPPQAWAQDECGGCFWGDTGGTTLSVKCWDTCSECLCTQFCWSRFWNLSCWMWSYCGLVLKALFFLPETHSPAALEL